MARAAAFSLLELVLVIVILGVIAAIAVPRLSRAGSGASESAVAASLTVLQSAIDRYEAEHLGQLPDPKRISDQLLLYSNEAGDVVKQPDADHLWGPYLRKLPALTVGPNAGASAISDAASPDVGWIYQPGSGRIYPNLYENGAIAPDLVPLLGLTGPPLEQFKKTGILP